MARFREFEVSVGRGGGDDDVLQDVLDQPARARSDARANRYVTISSIMVPVCSVRRGCVLLRFRWRVSWC